MTCSSRHQRSFTLGRAVVEKAEQSSSLCVGPSSLAAGSAPYGDAFVGYRTATCRTDGSGQDAHDDLPLIPDGCQPRSAFDRGPRALTRPPRVSTKPGFWGIETEAQQLASRLTRSLPVTVASVALWDEPSLSLAVKAVTSLRPLDQSLPLGARVALSDARWHRTAFQQGEPILVEGDRETGFRCEAELALMPNLRSMYLVPIRSASDTVGVLGLGEMRAPEREPLSADKRERCRAILDEFVAATAHAWDAWRLRRQVRVMSSLMQLVRGVSTARSVEDILRSLSSEAADWLGAPVHGALLRISRDDVRLLARSELPEGGFEDGGRQLVLAMTRTAGREAWPVSVTLVGDDPLDPLGAMDPGARRWTRLGVPLMRDDRLIGVACLYVEDEVRLTDWELEALRRRGEIAACGVEAVEAARVSEREQDGLHRTILALLTGYPRALLHEVFGGLQRALPALLRSRLGEAAPGLAPRDTPRPASDGEAPELVGAVVAEVSAVVAQLWKGIDQPEGARVPLDVNEVVGRALPIARLSLEERARRLGVAVDVRFQPSAGLLPIQGSLVLVGALVHAIENAAEVMPAGGEIQIRTSRDGGHALIVVEGSGPGPMLKPDGRPRFCPDDPGLVLAVVRAIAHRHGGRLTVGRRQGRGQALFLRLPLSSG